MSDIRKGCVYNLLSEATCSRGSFRCDRKHRGAERTQEELSEKDREFILTAILLAPAYGLDTIERRDRLVQMFRATSVALVGKEPTP